MNSTRRHVLSSDVIFQISDAAFRCAEVHVSFALVCSATGTLAATDHRRSYQSSMGYPKKHRVHDILCRGNSQEKRKKASHDVVCGPTRSNYLSLLRDVPRPSRPPCSFRLQSAAFPKTFVTTDETFPTRYPKRYPKRYRRRLPHPTSNLLRWLALDSLLLPARRSPPPPTPSRW